MYYNLLNIGLWDCFRFSSLLYITHHNNIHLNYFLRISVCPWVGFLSQKGWTSLYFCFQVPHLHKVFTSFYFFTLFLLLTQLQTSPFSLPLPTFSQPPSPASLWPSPHCHLSVGHIHVLWLIPSLPFIQAPSPIPLTAVSLSMPLVLFCSPVHLVHWIPHINEITEDFLRKYVQGQLVSFLKI